MKLGKRIVCLGLASMLPLTLFAEEKSVSEKRPSKEEVFSEKNMQNIAEMYGHIMYKSLDNPLIKLNPDSVIKGFQDAKKGQKEPFTEEKYEELMQLVQEYAYQDLSDANLQKAEKFLEENASKEGVKVIQEDRLQYSVLKEGTGEEVTLNFKPVIRYTGKYVDGTVFGSTEEGDGEGVELSLKSTIQGFREGVLGMKVGEKRRLFIHPQMGYGTSGQLLPNALLIFDIEVIGVKPEEKEGKSDVEISSRDPLFPDALDQDGDDDLDDDDDIDDGDDEFALDGTEEIIKA